MIRYAITQRDPAQPVGALLEQVRRVLAQQPDFLQIREKDLEGGPLYELTRKILALAAGTATRVVVNGRTDVALAAGAQGVHLPRDPIPPGLWRRITPPGFLIGVSCHDKRELRAAAGADYVLFSPVFAPRSKAAALPPTGLDGLREACRIAPCPVYALGGITWENAPACLSAGAAGVAGISLFAD